MTPPAAVDSRRRDVLATTVLVGALAALLGLGVVLGVVSSFLSLAHVRLFGVRLPIGPLVAVVANLTVGLLGSRGTGTRAGAVLPGLGWLGAILPFAMFRPEGDLVIDGSAPALAFLLLGSLAWAVAAGLGPGRPAGATPAS